MSFPGLELRAYEKDMNLGVAKPYHTEDESKAVHQGVL
jgi:hypothetical protein